MVVRRTWRRRRVAITAGMTGQLCHGRDFFGDGYGESGRGGMIDLELMREHWQAPDIQRQVRDRQAEKHRDAPAFAELAFGPDGEKLCLASDVPRIRLKYYLARDAAIAREFNPGWARC